jgi:hypothetical protein
MMVSFQLTAPAPRAPEALQRNASARPERNETRAGATKHQNSAELTGQIGQLALIVSSESAQMLPAPLSRKNRK